MTQNHRSRDRRAFPGWSLSSLAVLVTGLLGSAGALVAQQQRPPPTASTDSLVLRAEREVFAYPGFERRNPFKPLTSAEGGPRFEVMRLQGIIYSTEPGRSVALLTAGRAGARPAPGQPTAGASRAESARLRTGERWGNVRIVEILRDRIIVDVEEFGLAERREMRLQTRSQGGSS
ncbi:MAG: hypothetical protein RQ751_10055 [Longimicrobiales bacterium]|nr:hypothetical protein [Longimicrobiales bacterium]